MLATKLRNREKLVSLLKGETLVVLCTGCREVHFPEEEIRGFLAETGIKKIILLDYACREEYCRIFKKKYEQILAAAEKICIFSCGSGVQALAKTLEEKRVVPGCDSFYVNGFQGFKAQNRDCEQCAECRLNDTGGICPLTACSKSLLNGPCGGASNGKCEVNGNMDCGWELIFKRMGHKYNDRMRRDMQAHIRDYEKLITGGE